MTIYWIDKARKGRKKVAVDLAIIVHMTAIIYFISPTNQNSYVVTHPIGAKIYKEFMSA